MGLCVTPKREGALGWGTVANRPGQGLDHDYFASRPKIMKREAATGFRRRVAWNKAFRCILANFGLHEKEIELDPIFMRGDSGSTI